MLNKGWSPSPQIWSLGVEEQFYLFWPIWFILFAKKYKNGKRFIIATYILLVILTIFPYIFKLLNDNIFHIKYLSGFVKKWFSLSKYNCMAFGGLLGYLLASNKIDINHFLFHKKFAIVWILITIIFWGIDINFGDFTDEIYAIIFGILILYVSLTKDFNIDTKIGTFLGKISYGIYMYHWIILVWVLKILKIYEGSIYYNILLYFLVFSLTILVSYISYNTYEKFFLKMKK